MEPDRQQARQPQAPDWADLFSGTENLEKHMGPEGAAHLQQLDKLSDDPKEGRAGAVLQSYLQSELPALTPEYIAANFQNVKEGYAKHHFNIDEPGITNSKLYDRVGQEFEEREKGAITPGDFSSVDKFLNTYHGMSATPAEGWATLNKPFVELPKCEDFVNNPWAGPANPALWSTTYNRIFKPIMEGVESPFGVMTMGIGGVLSGAAKTSPIARQILAGMSGFFGSVFVKAAVHGAPETMRVMQDPNSTTQDRLNVLADEVRDITLSVLGGVGAVHELRPELAKLLEKKSPGQAAEILKVAALTEKDPVVAAKIDDSGEKVNQISDEKLKELDKKFEEEHPGFSEPGEEPPLHEPEPHETEDGVHPSDVEAAPLSKEEEAQMRAEEMGEISKGQSGEDLLKWIKGRLPHPETAAENGDALSGELKMLRDHFAKPDKNGRINYGASVQWFAKKGKEVMLDRLVEGAREQGFDFQTPHELLSAVDQALRERAGKEEGAARETAVKTEDTSGLPQSEEGAVNAAEAGEPGAAKTSAQRETGLKNAMAEMERKVYGFKDATPAEKRAMAPAWERAGMALEQDPKAGERLAEQLKANPNLGVSDDQSALLLRHKNGLSNALNNAAALVNDSGMPEDVRNQAQKVVQDASKELNDLMDAVHRRGSEWGREGRWRQAMAKEDYTFATQQRLAQAAKGGAPLNDVETVQLVRQLKDLQSKVDAYEAHIRELQTAKRSRTATSNTGKNVVVQYISEQANSARERIKARMQEGRSYSGLDPEELLDHAIIGAEYLAKGIQKAGDWSVAMVKEFGDYIRPDLDKIRALSEQKHQEMQDEAGGAGRPTQNDLNLQAGDLKEKLATQERQEAEAITPEVQDRFDKALAAWEKEIALGKKYTRTQIDLKMKDLEPSPEVQKRLKDALDKWEASAGGKESRTQLEADIGKMDPEVAARMKEALDKWENEEKPQPTKGQIAIELGQEGGVKPGSDEDVRLNRQKARWTAQLAKLEEKIRIGDYAPEPKVSPVEMDDEAHQLRGQVERAKQKIAISRMEMQEAAKPPTEKLMDMGAGGARASALSGYHTLAKLASFSVSRLAEMPATEALGAMIRQLPGMKEISAKANLEGGAEARALGKAFAGLATKGGRDAWQTLVSGKSDLKAEVGDTSDNFRPVHWYDYFGISHAAEKAPLFRAAFELALEKNYANAIANGRDCVSEFGQAVLRKEAGDYANRAILQNNSMVADAINGFTRRLEAIDPKTGEANQSRYLLSTLIKAFVTKGIVKTPMNYIAQTLERTPMGLALGTSKAVAANLRGIDKLSNTEANTITRLMKVGAVGSAMFVWGAIDATKKEEDRIFGGYYQPGDKRKTSDVGFGRMRIDGYELPHFLTHNPLTESAQMGNTMVRVAFSKESKHDEDGRGYAAGILASVLALGAQAPIANPLARSVEAAQQGKVNKLYFDLVTGLIPQLSQNLAVDTDDAKRKAPKTLEDAVKQAVPGLREDTPKDYKHSR